MSAIDPRQRQRAAAPIVRSAGKRAMTNEELAREFDAALIGRVSEQTRSMYHYAVRDARAYFTNPDGSEIPVSEWTKEACFGYIQHVEDNYCADFRSLAMLTPPRVMCEKNVWKGHKVPEKGLAICSTCSHFRRPTVKHRLNGLTRFFDYLSGQSQIPVNFMRDVRMMHRQTIPKHALSNKGEKKRNPTRGEVVRLVNGTAHPVRRFLYAASAKWWTRPGELFMLDRYGSFGTPTPEGVTPALGCERGYAHHPDLKPYHEGGRMVYIPDTKGMLDKRQGNRWLVVDDELRPIVDAMLSHWDRCVRRGKGRRPVHTKLVINERGMPMSPTLLNDLFFEDCERLGLMVPGDRKKKLRKWTGHCQRHFGEKEMQELEVPQDWQNHLRGDKFHDARGDYYAPPPEKVEEKYLKWIPHFGFLPVARCHAG